MIVIICELLKTFLIELLCQKIFYKNIKYALFIVTYALK